MHCLLLLNPDLSAVESGDEDDAVYEPSDYVGTLLRDPTSSHLLETLVRRLPENVFGAIWRTYFAGKLARLAAHPVANFVVAKTLERVSATQLEQTCEELSGASTKIYRTYIESARKLHGLKACSRNRSYWCLACRDR